MSFRRKADIVAHELIHAIVRGDVAVGGILPKEEQLAITFGVNRQVVREAMKTLEVNNLVRPIKRRGTEVMDPLSSSSPGVLAAMLAPAPNRIDIELLGSLLETQAIVESEMYLLAAQRGTEADFRAIEKMLPVLAGCKTVAETQLAYPAFYRTVAKASKNRIFEVLGLWNAEVIGALIEVLAVSRPNNAEFAMGLTQLIEMIKKRKGAEAKQMVLAYYQWYVPRVLAAAKLASNNLPEFTGLSLGKSAIKTTAAAAKPKRGSAAAAPRKVTATASRRPKR
ncbi:MAG: FadR family transcriptional regulator [Myxococcales bacterium]|nr:FadR family transcriptional regulator [Myxococcales bacterium]